MGRKKGQDGDTAVRTTLRSELEAELGRREGAWPSFTAAVFRQIDEQALLCSRMELEDQAMVRLQEEVDLELHELAPGFEEAFREGVERRIWRSARDAPGFFAKLKHTLSTHLEGRWRMGWAWAGAGATALMLAFSVPDAWLSTPMERAVGQVTVEDLSFEGTVTVVPREGMTVVWLSPPA